MDIELLTATTGRCAERSGTAWSGMARYGESRSGGDGCGKAWIHYPALDWLRLILALSVALSHIWGRGFQAYSPFPLPFTAVPSFLAISGFCILGSWQSSPSISYFWLKRVTRLLPAFILSFLLVGVLFGFGEVGRTFATYSHVGFGGTFSNTVNPPLWSLAAEEIVYVALSIVAAWLTIRNLKSAVIVAIIAYVGFCGIGNVGGLAGDRYLALIPAFIYGLYVRESGFRFPLNPWALLVGCFALSSVIVLHHGREPMAWALWNVLSFVTVLELGRMDVRIPKLKGDVSYGIYIYHYPILLFLISLGVTGLGLYALLPITLALSIASLLLAERPVLRLRQRLVARRNPPLRTVRDDGLRMEVAGH